MPGGSADRDRPLAPRGRRDATVAGAWLRDNAGHLDLNRRCHGTPGPPDLGAESPGRRTTPPEVREDGSDLCRTRQAIATADRRPSRRSSYGALRRRIIPGLESRLASTLSGSDVELSTSGIAVLDLAGPWAEVTSGSARLRATVTARAE